MQRFRRVLIALISTLPLSAACFSSQTLIKVKADGSGTIEQTNLVSAQMLGMASAMAQGVQSDDVKQKGQLNVKDLFSEERFKAQAAEWGAGVRYMSSEPLTQGDMQGAKAVYAFDNINGLVMGKQRSDRPEPQMLFSMQKPSSGSSLLTIEFPRGAAKDLPAGDAGAPARTMSEVPPEAMAMMKSMLAGARLGVELEVDGRVIKTNAPASSGSRVTLVDIDIAALMADPKHLEAVQLLRPGTDFETVRQALKDVPGITIPTDPKVTVEFGR